MLVGPIEAEHGTPVVQHECHVVAEIQCIPEREQVVALFGVVIAVRARRVQFVRPAHADQVGGDETAQSFQVWHYVAPQVGRRGVAVRKHNGIAVALVDVGHPVSADLTIVQLRVGFCSDHGVPPKQFVSRFTECGCGSDQQPDSVDVSRLNVGAGGSEMID